MKTIINNTADLARITGGIITDIDPLEDVVMADEHECIITDILELEDKREDKRELIK